MALLRPSLPKALGVPRQRQPTAAVWTGPGTYGQGGEALQFVGYERDDHRAEHPTSSSARADSCGGGAAVVPQQ